MKIIVASGNPVKINASRNTFEKVFKNEKMKFQGIAVASQVSDQPMSDEETFQGAINRARNAQKAIPDAEYWIGLEGGLQPKGEELEAFAWIVILSQTKMGKARTSTFFLPHEVAHLVNEGVELGKANDIIFSQNNSKQKGGAVGILTHGQLGRTEYYEQAVLLALIPFVNSQLY
ncbi:inosine/xanthosine triphosphatase [Xanthovirga aplysinae]|uniref:inosine/xanthosine triphosphatase n=1 Tax=Xanthovirga aplysinae TaxID=2529853 RepID=UPI0012BC0598|nr:inosine/xanthosine triphosphatase [Xanthovirga aplysinae]MTI32188.1 non-canonical purine NTP phosphatase [Xanthovirga aplysinae]